VLVTEASELAERLLDDRLEARHRRSPFRLVPLLRTDFWPMASAALAVSLAGLWLGRPSGKRAQAAHRVQPTSADPRSTPDRGVSTR
jgi:hypothetical protein